MQVELSGVSVESEVAGLQSRFIGVGIALSVAAAVLFLLPMRFLTRPLLDLTAAARRLAGGETSARVQIGSDDEIGQVGRAFNSMAEAIEVRTRMLERTADDLRERKNELGHERDRLRAVISSMRDGLVVLDADGAPIVHNGAAGPLLKQLRSEGAEIHPHHLCENAQETLTACQTCLFSPQVGPRSCVVEIDGGVFEIHAARLAPGDDGRAGRVLVSRDITGRVAQDERQMHQERLAVLGEVAAVMAHELNNPLAAISMYNQMLGAELADDPDLAENVEVIQRNVTSCKRAIRELLDYATDATPEVNVVDIHATLADVAAFLRPLLERSTVELRLELQDEPLAVTGDEVQIRQIFTNLIVNAAQAAGERTGNGSTERWIAVRSAHDGAHATILVADNGGGISPEVREKIFRPFYSTKGRGGGTGLGLPTARRIAELHGGGLDLIDSDEGGSVFRVRLRLHQEVTA
jgi:signal transduction histidine kinase